MENFFVTTYGIVAFILLIIWSTVWKGLALWRAAKQNSTVWFVVFVVLNTAGVLEIIYLYFIARKKSGTQAK